MRVAAALRGRVLDVDFGSWLEWLLKFAVEPELAEEAPEAQPSRLVERRASSTSTPTRCA